MRWPIMDQEESEFPFFRKFYVCASSNVLYSMLKKNIAPIFNDGKPRIYSTVATAIAACTANRGDTIYILPGHTEALTSTSFAMATAGIRIVGLGTGTLIPTFTAAATSGIVAFTAANCWLENVKLVANVDNTVGAISLDAGSDGTTIKDVVAVDTATNKEFLTGISIATTCTDVVIDGFKHWGLAGGATSAIVTAGTADRLTIKNCIIQGTYSASVLDLSAGILVQNIVARNYLVQRTAGGVFCYKGNSASTGLLVENMMAVTNNGTNPVSEVTAMHCVGNIGIDVAAAGGITVPAAGTI
jgi:hypothetical protein